MIYILVEVLKCSNTLSSLEIFYILLQIFKIVKFLLQKLFFRTVSDWLSYWLISGDGAKIDSLVISIAYQAWRIFANLTVGFIYGVIETAIQSFAAYRVAFLTGFQNLGFVLNDFLWLSRRKLFFVIAVSQILFWRIFSQLNWAVDIRVSVDGDRCVLILSFGIGMWCDIQSIHGNVIRFSLRFPWLCLVAALKIDIVFIIFGDVWFDCGRGGIGVFFVGALWRCFSKHSK